jgi:hypothetical protein
LQDDQVGPGIFQFLGVEGDDRVSEAEMNRFAHRLRAELPG